MVSEHARMAFERKSSAELLELRSGGMLAEELNGVLDEVLRARGINPAAPAPASSLPTKPAPEDPVVAARRVRAIGWFQILAGVAMLFAAGLSTQIPGEASWVGIALLTLVSGLNIAAGVLTLRGQRAGYQLSIWNHAAQIPIIGLPGFIFYYMGLGSVSVVISRGIHVDAQINPGFLLTFGGTPQHYFIGVDLLAIGIVSVLLSALRLQKR